VAIIGLGASGVAAARLALDKGADVYVSDLRTEPAVAARRADLRTGGASIELGGHDIERLAGADLVVVSPGIPPDSPVLRALSDRGVGWISEPEFAVRFFSAPLIAVTGTNGKTTTTLFVAHLLQAAGLRAAVGGNVGGGLAPAASELALREETPDWYVLEMSSFQLADVDTFRPDIGVITNLSSDHLDRYSNLDAYYSDKARIFNRAHADSVWVLPVGDVAVLSLVAETPGTRFFFGELEHPGTHAFVSEGVLTLRTDAGRDALITTEELPLLGRHNLGNALAASITARLAGANAEGLRSGLRSMRPLPHRLEPVANLNGVLWVDDSKATNVAATRSALESLDRPVVLLVGGKDKGEDFSRLVPDGAVVRSVIAYGAAASRIVNEVPGSDLVEGGLETAVRRAVAIAQSGDVVLLSPACSSFDEFEDYEERGRKFTALAQGAA
jgi:UDP-N-acetylmuramoylalanine--D-glutamate ligase